MIKEVAEEVISNGFSDYPIFIAHIGKVGIGELILDRDELNTNWSIQVSTLEEFVKLGIIGKEKEQSFKQSYKNPKEQMCVFLFTQEGASFVYFPYAKEEPHASSD